SIFRLSIFRLSIFRLSIFRLSIFRLSIFRLSIFRLSIFRLSILGYRFSIVVRLLSGHCARAPRRARARARASEEGTMIYRNTRIYSRSLDLIDLCDRILRELPMGFGFMADQLRRAASSVPLNFA